MASLWIRSGYDMKVEVLAETYQVGAHFKALMKAILVAQSFIICSRFMSPYRAVAVLLSANPVTSLVHQRIRDVCRYLV